MAKYTIRQPEVSPTSGYQPNSFEASTFKELKAEIKRNGAPWFYGTGFHVLDSNGDVLFTDDAWKAAYNECDHDGKTLSLKIVTEWAEEFPV